MILTGWSSSSDQVSYLISLLAIHLQILQTNTHM